MVDFPIKDFGPNPGRLAVQKKKIWMALPEKEHAVQNILSCTEGGPDLKLALGWGASGRDLPWPGGPWLEVQAAEACL